MNVRQKLGTRNSKVWMLLKTLKTLKTWKLENLIKLSSCLVVKLSSLILETCWTTFVFMSMLKSVKLSGCQVWSLGHAEQLLFSCQCSKVSSCQVVKLSSSIPWDSGHAEQMFLCLCSNQTVYRRKWQWFFYTLSCEFRVHRAGSQVIIGIVQVSVFVW